MDTGDLYQSRAELLKVLAHPLRLQIVRGLLRCGCRNVGCMVSNTGQSQPCVSQHLAKLKAAGVVRAVRAGNEVLYEISDPAVAHLMAVLFEDQEEEYHGI